MTYPKRLIEVDLPIKRISGHSRREKSIRHGHISTLHIWWARRPLAACRAVICAALWPDPADPLCPPRFREVARRWMGKWARENLGKLSPESYKRFIAIQKDPERLNDNEELRGALLDFISDFANWDNSKVKAYLDASRALTQAAHEALGGASGTRPLVVDPFAGGGSIPLEALRVGADAFASDLNPIPVLLNKVVLEYIPKYGQRLADEVRRWGAWIKQEAEKELAAFYPKDPDGATPIAYLWARTIRCEGPSCGAEVPLLRGLWLSKKAGRMTALRLKPGFTAGQVSGLSAENGAGFSDSRDGRPTSSTTGVPPVGSSTTSVPPVGSGDALEIRRRKLPHWRLPGAIYFVTFTADREAPTFRPFTSEERDIVLSACRHWHEKRAFLYGAVVMPDHVHLLVQPHEGEELSRLLHSIKSYSAHAVNESRRSHGPVWLPESMDRIIRDEYEFAQKLNYLIENPLRKSLVAQATDYPWLFLPEHWPTGRRPVVLAEIFTPVKASEVGHGTVARGSATCPCCGYTTRVESVRRQLKARRGGADAARLLAVVTTRPGQTGRFYRLPTERDLAAVAAARAELERRKVEQASGLFSAGKGGTPVEMTGGTPVLLPLAPEEPIDIRGVRHTWGMTYGLERWGDLFTARQLLALTTLARLVVEAGGKVGQASGLSDSRDGCPTGFAEAVQTGLALAVSRQADKASSLGRWDTSRENPQGTFGRQALPIVWDFCEVNPLSGAGGDFDTALNWVSLVIEGSLFSSALGHSENCSAASHVLPDDSAQAFVTDPPYYDAVPYAYLSDFFYVWLKRSLAAVQPSLFTGEAVPKDEEIVVDRPHKLSQSHKDIAFYEAQLTRAFSEGRRIVAPDGVGVIVFASKTTASWEAVLQAVIEAGWVITGSWPIDTEMETRVAAQGQARLASSVHIVVRPRVGQASRLSEPGRPENSRDGCSTGDWRDVLAELPRRIHEWMPRLAEEGVVGADAIFACLGPALEIFSRYSRVEKASGEVVTLREYLEQVWAAVAKEALAQVFKDADTAGFEPDARLTAMWLWTLNAGAVNGDESPAEEEEADEEEETKGKSTKAKGGFVLEYDAARKIAQGLGAHLEDLDDVVEVSGDTARLLPVSERTAYLFGKEQADAPAGGRKKKAAQMDLFGELAKAGTEETAWLEKTVKKIGETTLDRVHQAMILFAAGRGEALKRFLVEDGAGRDQRFWRLAQALSALYPSATSEKRWVDGVLARKKGLGL